MTVVNDNSESNGECFNTVIQPLQLHAESDGQPNTDIQTQLDSSARGHDTIEIGLCMPVSTASCERGSSLQNRIKLKSRTSLLPANLERLMKLASGPDIQSFPLGAVTHWYMSRRRRLARLYQSSKSKYNKNDPDLQHESHDIAFNEGELEECEEVLAQ